MEADDRRLAYMMHITKAQRLLRSEMEQMQADVKTWIMSQGYQQLRTLLIETSEAQGTFSVIGQLHSAIFGGEYQGTTYDGFENLTFDELEEALQCCKEGHMKIRECIRAQRLIAKDSQLRDGGYISQEDRTGWDF